MSRRDFLSFRILQPWGAVDPRLLVKFLAEKQKLRIIEDRILKFLKFFCSVKFLNKFIDEQCFLDKNASRKGKIKQMKVTEKKKEEFMISGFNQEGDIESIVLKYEEL